MGSTSSMVLVDGADRARKSPPVRALYEDFLGRAASEAEALQRVSRMDLGKWGMWRYGVATALPDQRLISAVVTRSYQDTLGRVPDPAGLAFCVRLMREGRPIGSIASDFYASDEYLARRAGDLGARVRDLPTSLQTRAAEAGRLQCRVNIGRRRTGTARGLSSADPRTPSGPR